MSFLVFVLSLSLVLGVFFAERELTRNSRKYPWLHRVDYLNRPAVIGFATLAVGLIVWALPPHCDAVVGCGVLATFLGCWMTETRNKPITRDHKYEWLMRWAHPLGR